ncbi:MAG: cation transporter [Bacteroidetes bacterium SW_10_40_5]|nr:MAG: cation transporter [Bacteroidetes bacterium SW_10_40_5]
MERPGRFDLPEHLKPVLKKATRLEWVTLVYDMSVLLLMYLLMGTSQAMKSAFLQNILGLLPTIAFLIASRIYNQVPNAYFPYGYHRVFSIAFLAGSLALFGMGIFLIFDSTSVLLMAKRPDIGYKEVFGWQIWAGWLMMAVLVYSALPGMLMGYKKTPLARQLHNKVLFTDANTQKANYMTSLAAILGIAGVGLGYWWADGATALIISFFVLKDGFTNLRTSTLDLMDRHPVQVDGDQKDELVREIEDYVRSWSWVRDADVRFREQGQVYFGEVCVTVQPGTNVVQEVEEGVKALENYNWRIHDVVLMPVETLPERSVKK